MANPVVYEIEPNQLILSDLPDQCEISYEGFNQDNGMQHHIERVYEGKNSNIVTLQAHDKEKQTWKDSFKCKICNKTFSSRGSLKTHKAGVHDGKKVFQCELCNLKFTTRQNKIRHIVNIHEGSDNFLPTT